MRRGSRFWAPYVWTGFLSMYKHYGIYNTSKNYGRMGYLSCLAQL